MGVGQGLLHIFQGEKSPRIGGNTYHMVWLTGNDYYTNFECTADLRYNF